MRSINFSTDNVAIQWQYVKRNLREMGMLDQTEVEDIEAKATAIINRFFQQSIYEEFYEQIKADWHERTPLRIDVRSGTCSRLLTTTFGQTRLSIPKVRKKSREYIYTLFNKYQRRRKKFDDMVALSLLLGFSTYKQRRFFRAFIGDSVSHQTASRLLKALTDELRTYQTRPIEDRYAFLIIDGLWIHIKELDIKKRPILFALGITRDGE